VTIENKPEAQPPQPPLSGRRKGFQSGVTMSCDQVAKALEDHRRMMAPGSMDPDDLMTGVVATVLSRATHELCDFILAEGEKGTSSHTDLMRKMRARGVRMVVQVMPLEPGEGEMDHIDTIPIAAADAEVLELESNANGNPCGVLGCDRQATHVVRSMEANTGCWLCLCHAAEIERAIVRKRGGA
jgi:hypothetical protein